MHAHSSRLAAEVYRCSPSSLLGRHVAATLLQLVATGVFELSAKRIGDSFVTMVAVAFDSGANPVYNLPSSWSGIATIAEGNDVTPSRVAGVTGRMPNLHSNVINLVSYPSIQQLAHGRLLL